MWSCSATMRNAGTYRYPEWGTNGHVDAHMVPIGPRWSHPSPTGLLQLSAPAEHARSQRWLLERPDVPIVDIARPEDGHGVAHVVAFGVAIGSPAGVVGSPSDFRARLREFEAVLALVSAAEQIRTT